MLEAGPDDGPAFTVPGPLPDGVRLWLIRHGETTWSKAGRHTGKTDLPLTATGEAQALGLRDLLAGIRPVLVLSSPRERALSTARLAGLRVDAVDDDLAEWDYGDYEGLTTTQIRERVPGWTIWTGGAPNGETIAEVSARVDRVLHSAAEQLGKGPVVLIAHGHVGRVIGARWIGLPASEGRRLALEPASPSVLSTQHDVPVIDRWNIANPAASEGDAP
jgi:broad specificity phosphatase PhoE